METAGGAYATGVYFCRLHTDESAQVGNMMMVR